jgi:phage/plasmid-like protein (TIGR03299 family)
MPKEPSHLGNVGLSYRHPITGRYVEAQGSFGVVRQDTGAILGAVGSRYVPIQNADGFEMLDGVLSEYGAKYEAAGSLYGGARVFMLVRLPEQVFTVGYRDEVQAYALFTNPHDGTGVAQCFATSERVVCANTLRVAMNRAKGGLRIGHTGSIKTRIADARSALGITCREFERFAEDAAVLATTPCPDIRHYCNDVLDAVLDVTLADMKKGADLLAAMIDADADERELARKSFEKKIERRGEILRDMLAALRVGAVRVQRPAGHGLGGAERRYRERRPRHAGLPVRGHGGPAGQPAVRVDLDRRGRRGEASRLPAGDGARHMIPPEGQGCPPCGAASAGVGAGRCPLEHGRGGARRSGRSSTRPR